MKPTLLSLAAMVLLVTYPIVAAQNTPAVLEVGKPISRQLLGVNRDVFLVNLGPGQFLRLSVMQDGKYDIKIEELRLARPDEKKQSSEIQTLIKLDAERLHAESRQDKNALFRIYADRVLVVSPDSRSSIGDRRAILGADRLSPHQSIEETMTIDDVKVLVAEDTAVVSSIASVSWTIGEQRLSMRFCYSNTYVKRFDRWQLMASHMTLADTNPPKAPVAAATKLDPKLLDGYAGIYQLSSAIRLRVYKKGSKLILEGVDGSAYDLIPESIDSFVIKGTPAKRIFVRDSSGKVTHLLLTAMGQELKAIKIQ